MNIPTHESLGSLVERLRRESELSQAELGGPEFSPAYIDAVERNRLPPGPEALDLLARRLAVSTDQLRAVRPPPLAGAEAAAADEDLAYRLQHARLLLNNHPQALLERLAALECEYAYFLRWASAPTRFWLLSLRGMAHLRLNEPGRARPDLDAALELAPGLSAGALDVVRARNALGAAYYQLYQPARALQHHSECLRSLRTAQIKDKTMQVIVYSNLGNDYWALNDSCQALGMYKEALARLEDLDHPERRAAVLWGLFQSHAAYNEPERALLRAHEALALYTARGDSLNHALVLHSLADFEIEQGAYAAAEEHLAQARPVFEDSDERLYLGQLLGSYGALGLARGDGAAAAQFAEQSVAICATEWAAQAAAGDALAQVDSMRAYAHVLSTAGRIAEQQGRCAMADTRFQHALHVLETVTFDETAEAVGFCYAEVLAGRGAHESAVDHYRAAARHWPPRFRR